MKKVIFIIFPVLLLFSCKKGETLPRVETIKSGSKWTLKIGSSPAEVYNQLQSLSSEKFFNSVAIVYRKPYSKPQEIQNLINFYNAVTLQSNSGAIDRVLIKLAQNKVSSLASGGGMLDSVSHWPQNISNTDAIKVNDQIDQLYQKLLNIYQISEYSNYQIILPDKPLDKAYDIDLANYDEWAFEFTTQISNKKTGNNSVRLYFENKKLIKITNEYNEHELVN